MIPTKQINFSQNWNGKLNCHYYTTIRLAKPGYYTVNDVFAINLNDSHLHDAIILNVSSAKIYDITNMVYLLDTGYKKQQSIELLQRMYSKKNIDWNTQQLEVLLLENLNWK